MMLQSVAGLADLADLVLMREQGILGSGPPGGGAPGRANNNAGPGCGSSYSQQPGGGFGNGTPADAGKPVKRKVGVGSRLDFAASSARCHFKGHEFEFACNPCHLPDARHLWSSRRRHIEQQRRFLPAHRVWGRAACQGVRCRCGRAFSICRGRSRGTMALQLAATPAAGPGRSATPGPATAMGGRTTAAQHDCYVIGIMPSLSRCCIRKQIDFKSTRLLSSAPLQLRQCAAA